MWLTKPIYEALPYYYTGIGIISLVAGFYLDYWYWPQVCTVVGIMGLVAGLVVWLKRRDYRHSRSRGSVEDEL